MFSTWREEYLPKPMPASSSAGCCQAIFAGDPVVVGVGELAERHLVLARLAVEQLLADLDGALALMLVDPVLDLVAGAGALGEGEPIAAGGVAVLGDDFDDVAVAQLGAQRDHAAVDLGADAVLPTSVWME